LHPLCCTVSSSATHLPWSLPLIFFSRRRDHRHLHSFPTRRSSDLSGCRCASSRLMRRATTSFSLHVLTNSRYFWRLSKKRKLREDRKSTRLNSSHGSISYAVFCLKKKTKPHRSR